MTVAGPRFCPKMEMIARGETDVADTGTGFGPVPVWIALGKYEAAFTTVVMAGWDGLVTRKGVLAGACEGLLGGAGLVTASVHAIGNVAPAAMAR